MQYLNYELVPQPLKNFQFFFHLGCISYFQRFYIEIAHLLNPQVLNVFTLISIFNTEIWKNIYSHIHMKLNVSHSVFNLKVTLQNFYFKIVIYPIFICIQNEHKRKDTKDYSQIKENSLQPKIFISPTLGQDI